MVSGPKWHSRALAVIFGSGVVFAAFFALVLGGLSRLPDASTGTKSWSAYMVEAVAGAILLVIAAWLLRPHAAADRRMEAKVKSHADHASPTVFAGLAAYMTLTDFSTLVLIVPALHDITRSTASAPEKLLVVGFVFACVMLPVLSPPAAAHFLGERGLRALNRMYALLMGHQLQVMGAVAGVIGVLLLSQGLRGL